MTAQASQFALDLPDETATLEFAARLAANLPADAAPLVVHLHGDLGAGKTTLARGMLRAMGEQGAVRSPTYSLVAEYEPAGQRVVHLDLYRLQGAEELHALGLADYLPGSRLWLVEWPERAAGSGVPPPDASVWLEPTGAGRHARVVGHTAAGMQWMRAVSAEPG